MITVADLFQDIPDGPAVPECRKRQVDQEVDQYRNEDKTQYAERDDPSVQASELLLVHGYGIAVHCGKEDCCKSSSTVASGPFHCNGQAGKASGTKQPALQDPWVDRSTVRSYVKEHIPVHAEDKQNAERFQRTDP